MIMSNFPGIMFGRRVLMIIDIAFEQFQALSISEKLEALFSNEKPIPFDADYSSLNEKEEVESFTCHLLPPDTKAMDAAADINMIRRGPETLAWHENEDWPDFFALGNDLRKQGIIVRSDPNTSLGCELVDRINSDLPWTAHDRDFRYNFWVGEPTEKITEREGYARKKNGKYHLIGTVVHREYYMDYWNEESISGEQTRTEVLERIAKIPSSPRMWREARKRGANFRCLAPKREPKEKVDLLEKWIEENGEWALAEDKKQKEENRARLAQMKKSGSTVSVAMDALKKILDGKELDGDDLTITVS
jgi:hypothetical protein